MTHLPLARAVFGTRAAPPVPDCALTAAAIDDLLAPGQLAFITGPSGAGKSTILHSLGVRLRARRHCVIRVNGDRLPDRPVVDCVGAPFHTTLSLLSMCGLADGPVLQRRPGELSAGQRWRLGLAVALRKAQRCSPHATMLIDELGTAVDREAAHCLCRTIRRFIVPRAFRAVCASHDDSLLEPLGPSLLIVQPLHAEAIVRRGEGRDRTTTPRADSRAPGEPS